jgi:hypothetical protein
MNSYEEKQAAKKERYLERAKKARGESEGLFNKASSLGSQIPMGQPILVGHHSEKRHRNHLKKIDNAMRKGLEASEKAEYYQQKAASVGTGGISSDDPEAITKLKNNLEGLEKQQKAMKEINKIVKSKKKGYETSQKIKDLGEKFPWVKSPERLFEPDFAGRIGFPSYAMTNNNANIRRIRQRITLLESKKNDETKEWRFDGVTIIDNVDENRLQIRHDSKPPKEVRDKLKRSGFKWSRFHGVWQRHRGNAAKWGAEAALGVELT